MWASALNFFLSWLGSEMISRALFMSIDERKLSVEFGIGSPKGKRQIHLDLFEPRAADMSLPVRAERK